MDPDERPGPDEGAANTGATRDDATVRNQPPSTEDLLTRSRLESTRAARANPSWRSTTWSSTSR
ncbi:hypothetical protein SDIAM26S_01908 [Streptomyces diastaticus subsp. diastaticus]